jgi:hypothetical protein
MALVRWHARELAMYKHLNAVLTTGSVALTISLAATSPSAAATTTTWTVKPGGNFSAARSMAGSFVFVIKDTKTDVPIHCSSAKLTGNLKSGSGLPGAGIGSITVAEFGKCSYNIALPLTAHGLPWKLNALTYVSAGGVTTASLTGIGFTALGPGCHLTVDGTAARANDGRTKFTYTNSTGKLKLISGGGNLTFYAVSGCFGLFNDGDHAVMTGTLTVSPKQKITSP